MKGIELMSGLLKSLIWTLVPIGVVSVKIQSNCVGLITVDKLVTLTVALAILRSSRTEKSKSDMSGLTTTFDTGYKFIFFIKKGSNFVIASLVALQLNLLFYSTLE